VEENPAVLNDAMSGGVKIGVDIGGTFVDVVLIDQEGGIFTRKVLSTPHDYSEGVIEGVRQALDDAGLEPGSVREIVHGTTIVTNACIELTGARVGLITTMGFRDVLEITRGRMPRLYDLTWNKPPPLVPRQMRLEVNERTDKNGDIITPLDMAEVAGVVEKLVGFGAESIAVCLYNSPKNPQHEQEIGKYIARNHPEIRLSLSTNVMPLMKEYERTCETVVNAYVVPLVSDYLRKLKHCFLEAGIKAPLFVMQSSGGMITAEASAGKPIEIVECGPAAGVVGAAHIADALGISDMIAFDLGGTTCKAAIVENGRYTRSTEYEVGAGIHMASRLRKGKGYVLRVPSIDIAEIGAGGGSIVAVNNGGLLTVGPRSAGASPGPACYDKGGTEPTLTDCYVTLGYLNPDYLLGKDFKLNSGKALAAVGMVSDKLGMTQVETAYGAYRIANSNMARAIHAVSSERGRDPRKFVLLVFGGAGALHGVEVAKDLGIKQVVIAPNGGVFCAYGMHCADIESYYVKSYTSVLDTACLSGMDEVFGNMVYDARNSSKEWGFKAEEVRIERFVDIRYVRQSSELTIALPDGGVDERTLRVLTERFHNEHENTFGHSFPDTPLEINALRITASIIVEKPPVVAGSGRKKNTNDIGTVFRSAYFGQEYGYVKTRVLSADHLGEKPVSGPLLVDAYDTTVVVPPGCEVSLSAGGSLLIHIQ